MSIKISTTYSEDAETLAWIDKVRTDVGWHRGRPVSRADVIRWLTRRAKAEIGPLTDLQVESISSQI